MRGRVGAWGCKWYLLGLGALAAAIVEVDSAGGGPAQDTFESKVDAAGLSLDSRRAEICENLAG